MCVKSLVSFFKRLFKKDKTYVETPTIEIEDQPKESVDECNFPEKEEDIEELDEEVEYDDSIEDYGDEENSKNKPSSLYTFGIDPNKKYIFAPGYSINTKYKYFKLSSSPGYGNYTLPIWFDKPNNPIVCNFIDLYIRIKYNGIKKVEFSDKYLIGIGELMPPSKDNKLYAIINIDKVLSTVCKKLDHYPEYKEGTEDNIIIDKVYKFDFSIPFEMEDGSIYNLDAFCILGNDIK